MSVLNFSNQYLHECCDKLNIPKHSNKPKHKLLSLIYEALNIQNTLIQYDELKTILDACKKPVSPTESQVLESTPPKWITIQVKREKRVRQTRAPEKIKELVNHFAIEHKEDDRKQFKMAWQQWIISDEINKLLHDEYINDSEREIIIDKLYFSARYYHRKKELKKESQPLVGQSQEQSQPLVGKSQGQGQDQPLVKEEEVRMKKRSYNKTDKTILNNIDNHLQSLDKDERGFIVKPSVAFDKFVESYGKEYEEYKKIFKNRFYMFEKNIIAGR